MYGHVVEEKANKPTLFRNSEKELSQGRIYLSKFSLQTALIYSSSTPESRIIPSSIFSSSEFEKFSLIP